MEKTFAANSFWARWSPAIVIMIVIFIFSSIPGHEIPSFGSYDLSVKKLGHVTGYALLGVAYYYGVRYHVKHPRLIAWLGAVGYALTDEMHQYFVPGRSMWIWDVAIDAAGAFMGLILAPSIFRLLFPKL